MKPFTVWALDAPFDKHGVPRMGNYGVSVRRVVVMESETFKRLIDEHPSLKLAQFQVGSFPDEKDP